MTAPYRKKLIEVALPLEKINVAAAREKSIRHGHPSTLHLWWARRPLAACRAVLFASLVDDPDSDPAYRLLGEEIAAQKRADLFSLIEELVQWENSNNPDVIRSARAEIARCVASRLVETGKLKRDQIVAEGVTIGDIVTRCNCWCVACGFDEKAQRTRYSFDTSRLPSAAAVDHFLAEHAPPVLDPFAGGGSIPLEAHRLGLVAHASDLNPVAVLINKALIEFPPKFANRPPVNPEGCAKPLTTWHGAAGLADDVRYYGKWMRDEAEKRISHLYPKVKITKAIAKERPDLEQYVGQELTVIAWLWARTLQCPNPACGAMMPLARSFWLSSRKGKETWIEPVVDQRAKHVSFRIRRGTGKVPDDTVNRKGARCIVCGMPVSFDTIRAEGKANRLGTLMTAIVAEGSSGRIYLPADQHHEEIARSARPEWLPETEMPHNPFSVRPPLYGLNKFADVFTPRQMVALGTLSSLVGEVRKEVGLRALESLPSTKSPSVNDQAINAGYADAVTTYLALAISRTTNTICALALWSHSRDQSVNVFGRQAMPMSWDFPEVNPFAEAAGDFGETSLSMSRTIRNCPISGVKPLGDTEIRLGSPSDTSG